MQYLCYIIFTKNVFLLLDINTKNVILIISLKNIDNYDSLNEMKLIEKLYLIELINIIKKKVGNNIKILINMK